MNTRLLRYWKEACGWIAGMYHAPSRSQIQAMLLLTGIALLSFGILNSAHANTGGGAEMMAETDDVRIANATVTLLGYLEGSFGALVMVVSGVGAIMGAAFGQYKASLGCLVVAVGSFILRSFMNTFFDTRAISEQEG